MSSKTIHLPPAAADAIERGQLIEAIKIVRDANRIDLKSAKEAVEAHAARRNGGAPEMSARDQRAQASSLQFPDAASAALARGDLVETIKLVREANQHLGLKEAKDVIDTLRSGATRQAGAKARTQPRSMPTVMEGDRGLGGWMALIAVVIAAFAWWWLS